MTHWAAVSHSLHSLDLSKFPIEMHNAGKKTVYSFNSLPHSQLNMSEESPIQLFSYFKRHHPSLHVHCFTHQPTTELRSIDSFRASLMALLMTEDEEDASREGLFRPRPPLPGPEFGSPTDRSSHKMEDSWTVCTYLR